MAITLAEIRQKKQDQLDQLHSFTETIGSFQFTALETKQEYLDAKKSVAPRLGFYANTHYRTDHTHKSNMVRKFGEEVYLVSVSHPSTDIFAVFVITFNRVAVDQVWATTIRFDDDIMTLMALAIEEWCEKHHIIIPETDDPEVV